MLGHTLHISENAMSKFLKLEIFIGVSERLRWMAPIRTP